MSELPKGLRKLAKHLNGFIDANQYPKDPAIYNAVQNAEALLLWIEGEN